MELEFFSLPTYIAIGVLVLWNIITFSLYGIDKSRAKSGKRRISEATLFVCAFLMGGIGAFLGMRTFRHKTQHISFKILIPLAAVLNIGVLAGIYFLLF